MVSESNSLKNLVRSALAFVDRIFNSGALETSISLDPMTSAPSFATKLDLGDSSKITIRNIDDLLEECNDGLAEVNTTIWLMFDRLDVAFAENAEIEKNALRALFKAYSDIRSLDNIRVKIFIRDDIWERIFDGGFREASHLTKVTSIEWDRKLIINMLAKRLMNNPEFCSRFMVDPEQIISDISAQESLFYRIFPKKVDAGSNKPNTIDWVLKRTQDGLGKISPREIIHLLDESKKKEIKKFETGDSSQQPYPIVTSNSLKEGLVEVSKHRLNNTLLAEYPHIGKYVKSFEGGKARYSIHSLSQLWKVKEEEAEQISKQLVEVGFFEKQNKNGNDFWMPFLYRDALNVTQGTADSE